MSTCLLKRILPFMLTLGVGLGLGSLFNLGSFITKEETVSCQSSRHTYVQETEVYSSMHGYEDSTPLEIKYEPPTRLTTAARQHQTYGVVQLEVEYGADGRARVLDRIETLPDGLTEEAERVVELTEFKPEIINGEPTTVTRIQSFYFHAGRF